MHYKILIQMNSKATIPKGLVAFLQIAEHIQKRIFGIACTILRVSSTYFVEFMRFLCNSTKDLWCYTGRNTFVKRE